MDPIPTERIYIGGLDPHRLTVQDVSSRLQSIAGVDIVSIESSGDKSFFFVDARRCKEKDEEDVSALTTVAKLYHNVKWKGCKLSVEKAKPHFLERLAAERQERTQQRQNKDLDQKEKKNIEEKPPSIIPRHLRIRQRFGEEAYCVDRKPCVTGDWSNFSSSLVRMRKRREKHRQKLVEEGRRKNFGPDEMRLKPFLNRAVHLVFNGSTSVTPLESPLSEAAHYDDRSSTRSNTDSGTECSHTSTGGEDEKVDQESITRVDDKTKPPAYLWSGDDRRDSGDDADKNKTIAKDVFPVRSESELVLQNGKNAGNQGKSESVSAYVWSSDDEESSIDEEEKARARTDWSAHSNADEFTAGIDIKRTGAFEKQTAIRDAISVEMELKTDLQDDVKSNLDVLSKLFPDMTNVAPSIFPDSHTGDLESTREKVEAMHSLKTIQSGWEIPYSNQSQSFASKLGLMQRYDPTKESAKKYVVSQEPAEAVNSNGNVPEEQMEGDGKHAAEGASLPKETGPANESVIVDHEAQELDRDNVDNVYDQNKLENIFRHSREVEDASSGYHLVSQFHDKGASSTPNQGDETAKDKGIFAFSFDLNNEPNVLAKEESLVQEGRASVPENGGESFSFSFKIGEDAKAAELRAPARTVSAKTTGVKRHDSQTAIMIKSGGEQPVGIRRHWGLFPKKVIDKYEEDFFALNEGTRILEDLEGFRNDRHLRNQWLAERHTLTKDWKRKRKYAQSKMRKKAKLR